VNARHPLGRVNADSAVTYSVDIRLQSPEQFKYFFYKAARALKVVEQDFINELNSIESLGVRFLTFSSEPWETGERIIGELCAKQGFIKGSDGKSCLKALVNNKTLEVEYGVFVRGGAGGRNAGYDKRCDTCISLYDTEVSKVHEAESSSETIICVNPGEFTADKDMARLKETVASVLAFEEAQAMGNFEVTDEQEEDGSSSASRY
jgi:hypothetical protein